MLLLGNIFKGPTDVKINFQQLKENDILDQKKPLEMYTPLDCMLLRSKHRLKWEFLFQEKRFPPKTESILKYQSSTTCMYFIHFYPIGEMLHIV